MRGFLAGLAVAAADVAAFLLGSCIMFQSLYDVSHGLTLLYLLRLYHAALSPEPEGAGSICTCLYRLAEGDPTSIIMDTGYLLG